MNFNKLVYTILEKCWDGYVRKGNKKKGRRLVPNCVKESLLSEMPVDSIQHMSNIDNTQDPDIASYEIDLKNRDRRIFHNSNFLDILQNEWAQKVPFKFNLILNDSYHTNREYHNLIGKKGSITVVINPDAHQTTPWMIGHRVGHALEGVDGFADKGENIVTNWLETYGTSEDFDELDTLDAAVENLPTLLKITKFKGKQSKLTNGTYTSPMYLSEWVFDCMAQYLKYGHISFHNVVDGTQELEQEMLSLITHTLNKASQTGTVYTDLV